MDTKKVILNELSSRIERLEEHADTIKAITETSLKL